MQWQGNLTCVCASTDKLSVLIIVLQSNVTIMHRSLSNSKFFYNSIFFLGCDAPHRRFECSRREKDVAAVSMGRSLQGFSFMGVLFLFV